MVKKRTVASILEGLPEPYRSEAITNTIANKRCFKLVYYSDLVACRHVMCDALLAGFVWSKTKQGNDYWTDLYKQLKNGEI